MPENPLLPNRKLQELYSTMLRARSAASRSTGMEAIFASVALQLEPGDALVSAGDESTLSALLQPARRGAPAPRALAPDTSPLAFAAGVAAAAQMAGSARLAVVVLDPGKPGQDWPALFALVQRERLPLIVICPDRQKAVNSQTRSGGLSWTSLTPVAKKLRFAVLTVDGGDAVAMYRAMQESVLRARHGDGPALLWCLTSPAARVRSGGPSGSPVERLERYLAARKIALPRGVAGAPSRSAKRS